MIRKVNHPGGEFFFEPIYNIGDEVWYIFSDGLFVKCKITEIDNEFRKSSPGSYLFYDIDEPIGHFVGSEEIFPSLKSALWFFLEYLQNDFRTVLRDRFSDVSPENLTLDKKRKLQIDFIRKTQGEFAKPLKEWNTWYPKKKKGKDWFSIWDLITEKI
jgi:hypothetical protein